MRAPSSLRLIPLAAVAVAVVAAFPTPVVAATAAGVRCQKALLHATTALVGKRQLRLGRCALALARCSQAVLDPATCAEAVERRCARDLRRLVALDRALARRVRLRCGPGTTLAALGHGEPGTACPETAGAALLPCLLSRYGCAIDRLVDVTQPRMGELLRVAGVAPGSLVCLPDHGGDGGGLDDPADAGPAILRCARGVDRSARAFAQRRLAATGSCLSAVFACRGDDASDPDCLASARTRCDRLFRRAERHATRLQSAVDRACRAVPFDTLAGARGAALDALSARCAALGIMGLTGIGDYGTCLVRAHACGVEDIVATAAPRAPELLALVGRELASSFCPADEPGATPSAPLPTPTPRETAGVGPTATGAVTPAATVTIDPGPTGTPTPPPSRTATPRRTPTPTPEPEICGDGVVNGDEECDGADLDDNTCEDLCDQDDDRGMLRCKGDCTYDFSGCPGTDCEA